MTTPNPRDRSMESTVWSKPALPSDMVSRRAQAKLGSERLLSAIVMASARRGPPVEVTWGNEPIIPVAAVPLPSMQRYRPLDRIQKVVALSYNIRLEDMRSPRQSRSVAWPRQVAMYLCRELTPHSFPIIGRMFGGRHHTTVLHAVEAVEKRMAADPLYRADVEALREALR